MVVVILCSKALAEVQAEVDSLDIDETQFVTLRIEVTTNRFSEVEPDWSTLESDFHLLGRPNRNINFSIVNGKVHSSIKYSVRMSPKRIGTLTIPSFDIDGEKTDPITIVVRELDAEIKAKVKENVFFETKVDTARQYVQAAIHVTHRLYYSNRVLVRNEIPPPVDIPDTLIVTVGNTERTHALRGDKSYNVLEQRFVVFAERSGELVIPPIQTVARVTLDSRDVNLSIVSDEKTIEILPIPDEFPRDEKWFPAKNVRVTDSLSDANLDGLHVGDTIIREISISANDSHSTGIPEISSLLPKEIRQYPNEENLDDKALISGIVGTRTQSESLLLTEPGEFGIPSIYIYWWNTELDKLVRTVVSGRPLVVAPDPFTDTELENEAELDTVSSDTDLAGASQGIPSWWMNVLIAAGWTLAVVFGYLYFDRRHKMPKPKSTTPQVDLRSLYKQLGSTDPREVKHAMTQLLVQQLSVSYGVALRMLHTDEKTRRILHRLNDSLYAPLPTEHSLEPREALIAINNIVNNQKDRGLTYSTFLDMYKNMSGATK